MARHGQTDHRAGGGRPVYHRTLHALCERLRRVAPRVVAPVEGRIEVGATTGSLLRYFLPDTARGAALGRRPADRSHADWQAAAERAGGPWQLWRVQAEDGEMVGGITAAGVHYLARLDGDRVRRLGCRIIGEVPGASALARDVLGEWRG